MRKRKPKLRITAPDPVYGDTLVTMFVNNLMLEGKKTVALRVFYDALKKVKEKNTKPINKPCLSLRICIILSHFLLEFSNPRLENARNVVFQPGVGCKVN